LKNLLKDGVFYKEFVAVANLIYDGVILIISGLPSVKSISFFSIDMPISLRPPPWFLLFFYLDSGGNLDKVCIYNTAACFVRVFEAGL
jgi:hypothetical protein